MNFPNMKIFRKVKPYHKYRRNNYYLPLWNRLSRLRLDSFNIAINIDVMESENNLTKRREKSVASATLFFTVILANALITLIFVTKCTWKLAKDLSEFTRTIRLYMIKPSVKKKIIKKIIKQKIYTRKYIT